MGNENTYNNNAGSSDKCPKCGALKMFSAIRCPACGADYAAAARSMNTADINANTGTFVNRPVNNFDPNASFSAYKRSIEPQEGVLDTNSVVNGNTSSSAQTESPISGNIAEQVKPVKVDPIAQKLQEMAKQNNASTPVNAPAPRPGVYIPGASNQSSSYQGGQGQGTSYQGQLFQGQPQSAPIPGVYIPGASNQSSSYQGNGASGNQTGSTQGSPYQNTQPQMRYQGRPDIQQQPAGQAGAQANGTASPYASPYQSPYSRPVINTTSEKKSSPTFKIVIAVLLLAVLAMFGYGAYRYYNCDKNENGVSYSEGKSENGVYTNEWAEVKIDLSTGLQDYTPLVYTSDIQSSVNSLNRQLSSQKGSAEAIFLGAKLFSIGSQSTPIPGVVMFIITNDSFNAKLSGANLDTFFDDSTLNTSGMPAGSSITQVSDMILCGKSYRTYRMTYPMDASLNMDMYMCARAVGNKIVLFYLYSIPGYYDINTIKGYFIDN